MGGLALRMSSLAKSVGKLDLKILNPSKTSSLHHVRGQKTANQFVMWIESIMDELKKKCLKSVILAFYSKRGDPNGSVFESYKFSVTSSNMCSQSPDGEINVKLDEHANLRTKVESMLEQLVTTTATLKPLPNRVYVTLRLMYNDNKNTDHFPRGIEDGTGTDMIMTNPVTKMNSEVKTHFHSFK